MLYGFQHVTIILFSGIANKTNCTYIVNNQLINKLEDVFDLKLNTISNNRVNNTAGYTKYLHCLALIL